MAQVLAAENISLSLPLSSVVRLNEKINRKGGHKSPSDCAHSLFAHE